jgi:hypothetical protein
MIVKLFGYEDREHVSRIFIELPRKVDDLLVTLMKEGKLCCVACSDVLTRDRDRFVFSQVSFGGRKLSYHIVCGDCAKPLVKTIQEVTCGSREKKQARPAPEEAQPAAAGAGGGP